MKTKKLLSILLTFAMIVGLLPWSATGARADATTLTSGMTNWSGELVLSSNVTISGTVALSGDTTLTTNVRSKLTVDTINLNGHKLTVNGNFNSGYNGDERYGIINAKQLTGIRGDALCLNNYARLNVSDDITFTGDTAIELNQSAILNVPAIDMGTYTLTVISTDKKDGVSTNSTYKLGRISTPSFRGKLAAVEDCYAVISGKSTYNGMSNYLLLSGDTDITLAEKSELIIAEDGQARNGGLGIGSYKLTITGCGEGDNNSKLDLPGYIGKFYVSGNVQFRNFSLCGDTEFVLNDGCTLKTYSTAFNGHTLTVGGTGAYTTGYVSNTQTGAIVINGGTITAEDTSYSGCNAIGAEGIDVTINGGVVFATSRYGKDIIGKTVKINGGQVSANKGGIKGGSIFLSYTDSTDKITSTSYDGTVTVKSGKFLKNESGTVFYGTLDNSSSLNNSTLTPATGVHSISIGAHENGSITVNPLAAKDDTVTLTVRPNAKYSIGTVAYNDTPIEPQDGVYSFTMPDADVTVTATFTPKDASILPGEGTEQSPYQISNVTDWNEFCHLLEDYGGETRFTGYVELLSNITVTSCAGSDGHEFCGVFDGNGNTITNDIGVGYQENEDNSAVFSRVGCDGRTADIKNLVVKMKAHNSTGGLISRQAGTVTIQNCMVNGWLHLNATGSVNRGGFVGVSSGTLNITGCVSECALTSGTGNYRFSGFVGYASGTVNISDSLSSTKLTYNNNGGDYYYRNPTFAEMATFCRGGTLNITNSYYTTALGSGDNAAQGKAAHRISAGEAVTLGIAGDANAYGVSGVTSYSGSNGYKHGSAYYAGKDDSVKLTLGHGTRSGYVFGEGYTAGEGVTLDGATLTMPDDDVTVSALWTEMVKTPAFSPATGSTVIEGSTLTISCATADATIYYSVNNGEYAVYSDPFTISGDSTVRAYADKEGMARSAIAEATYNYNGATYELSVGAVTFDNVPVGYSQPGAKAITITNSGNSAATISSVTLSGSGKDDFTLSGGSSNTVGANNGKNTSYTIQPKAELAAGKYDATITVTYNNGKTATADVSFAVLARVAAPAFDKESGTYPGGLVVRISCDTEGADIYYTTDGKTPTTASTKYDSYVVLGETTTLKAIAVKGGMWNSDVTSVEYTVVDITYDLSVTAPTFDAVATGYSQPKAKTITVTNSGNSSATISSVTLDGAGKDDFIIAGGGSDKVEANGGTNTSFTVQPKANLEEGTHEATITVTYNNSTPATATVSFTVMSYVAAPQFTPAAGEYIGSQSVEITCETSGATFYYTTDGKDPTTASTKYTDAITVSTNTTIKAIAVMEGMAASSNSASYTIIPAKRTLELSVPVFADAAPGYSRPDAQAITIRNSGNQPVTVDEVYLGDNHVFELNKTVGTTIAVNASDTSYTLRPKAELSSGTYRTIVNVDYYDENGKITTAYATVAFCVLSTTSSPYFSPSGGDYVGTQTVDIACGTPGAAIYYTTDGKDPTTASTKYTGAITVDSDTTIKAIAVAEGFVNSSVSTAAYKITPSSGKDGDISWTLTKQSDNSYALSITGNNTAMPDYSDDDFAPWCENITEVRNNISSVTLSGVTTIGSDAFKNCISLSTVTLCDGITSIGSNAFYNCTSLSTVTLSDGITSIGSNAFHNCTSLKTVTLNNGLESIGEDAFAGCTSLVTVSIPSSVTEIGISPFESCTSLTAIYVGSSSRNYSSIGGVLYALNGNGKPVTLLQCPLALKGSISVPGTVTDFALFSFVGYIGSSTAYTSLSEIKFESRTAALYFGTWDGESEYTANYSNVFGMYYSGDCVLTAPDGMVISSQDCAEKSSVKLTDISQNTAKLEFHAKTAWNSLQEMLDKGGTVKLTRDYDYTKDSYQYETKMPATDENGRIIFVGDDVKLETVRVWYGKLSIPSDTILDLNGHTLNAAGISLDDEVTALTVKGGTLSGSLRGYDESDDCGETLLTLENAEVTLLVSEYSSVDSLSSAFLWSGAVSLKNSKLNVGRSQNGWMTPLTGAFLTMDADSSVTFESFGVDDYTEVWSEMAKDPDEDVKAYWVLLEKLSGVRFIFMDRRELGDDSTSDTLSELYQEQLGSYLPEGYKVVTLTLGKMVSYNKPVPADTDEENKEAFLSSMVLVGVMAPDNTMPKSVTFSKVQIGGTVSSSGELRAKLPAPEAGGTIVAAEYDASGRQTKVVTIAVNANTTDYSTGITVRSGYTYKLMLLGDKYVPQCEAWSKTAE